MRKKHTGETTDVGAEKQKKQVKQKKITLNQILKPILFLIVSLLFEIVNFNTLKLRFLPIFILFDLGAILLIAGLVFLCGKNWLSNIVFFLFVLFQCLLNIVNGTILRATDDVFFFELLSLTSEGMLSFDISFLDVDCIIYNFILLALTILSVFILDFFGKKKVFRIKQVTKPILLFLTFFVSWTVGLTFYSTQVYSLYKNKDKNEVAAFNSELWTDLEFKITGLESFGTYGFYVKDFYNTYLKRIDYDAQKQDYVKWLKEGEVSKNESAKLFGQNLIVICMESLDNFAVDPYNTPTLYNLLYNDGVTVTNFYSKNKTNISEDIGLLGYIPKTSKFKIEDDDMLSVHYSLPHLFKDLGYETNYFHTYTAEFYNRKNINAKMGFEHAYFIEDADIQNKTIEFNNWNSEVDFFNSMKDKMIPTSSEKPFFSFYMTVSAHGKYSEELPRFKKYYETYDENFDSFKTWLYENTPYTLPNDDETLQLIRNFKSAAMDTDAMLKVMIEDLQAKNLFDSTTILVYADHDCFYNNLSKIVKGEDGVEKYHLPLGLYNSNIGHTVIEDFTTVYSIYPTICELFGLAYNKNMCHGISLFDEDQSHNVMYSVEGRVGFFDKNCHSVTLLDLTKVRDGVTEEEVNKFLSNAKALREKQKKMNFIYKSGWTAEILK